jgi:uncharacterized lipoprotein YajG
MNKTNVANTRAGIAALQITAVILAAFFLAGCQANKYQQEAGVRAQWKNENPTNQIHVVYTFDTNTQTVAKIELGVTNAVEVTLLDGSKLRSNSAGSKSDMTAAGNRQGMLDNNTNLSGKASTESKLAEALNELNGIIRNLKAPVTTPTDE